MSTRVPLAALMAASILAGPALAQTCSRPTLPPLPPAKFANGPTIAPADLVSDFDGWMAALKENDPALTLRADAAALKQQAAALRATLIKPLSRREAWLHLALLNPVLRDGHNGIFLPDYRDALKAYLASGGHSVPLDPRFDADGVLRVFASDIDGIGSGDRIVAINGRDARSIASDMLARAPGDTLGQRRAWVARRFAPLFGILYGDTGTYDIAVQADGAACPISLRVPGATTLPVVVQSEPSPKDLFAWRVLNGGIGYLRVDSFDPGDKDALATLARDAFSGFAQAKIRALVIDVRENGGGDDPLWQQDLMEYITTKPYAQLSSYVAHVTKQNADPGDVIGTMKRDDYTKRFTPTPADPLRFSGPVYILTGPFSYSATIQFVVAAQDFGIAKIAGDETAGLSCQTGQVQPIAMPKTGLSAVAPSIAYRRPSGTGCDRGVMPDVAVAIDEIRPEQTLEALRKWIATR